MAALSATMAQVPSDRLGVRAWVDHAEIWLSVHFSPKCQVLGALQDILQYLRNPVKFSQYEATNFRALIWNLHCALRSFFGDGDVASLEYIAYQLKVNLVIATDGLPEAMRCPEVVTDSSSMGTDLSSLSQDLSRKRSAPPGLLHQEDTRRRRGPLVQPACFAILNEDIERARRACEPRQLKGRQLAEGSNGIRALFGTGIYNLMEDGKQPCLKLFIFGSCMFPDCRNGHSLMHPPSQVIMNGVRARVKTACDAIIRSQNPKA
jgi:hypothetical protein